MNRLENKGDDTVNIINRQAEKILNYYTCEFSRKFHLDVEIPEEVLKTLAYISLTRGGVDVWLNGKRVSLKGLVLRLNMDLQQEVTTF